MRVWFDNVTKHDARLLRKWWSRFGQFTIARSPTNRRFWALMRET